MKKMASQSDAVLGTSTNGFAVFGAVAASFMALRFFGSVFRGLRAYLAGTLLDFKKMGSWAAVTGATDGIGKAYAQELAMKGLNIVLISRNPDKLSDVAAEIESTHGVKTKCLAIDFSAGPEIYEKMREGVKDLEIGVLVNNVGMGYDFPDYFGAIPDQKILDLIRVNMTSVTMTTKVMLPAMVERKRGVIINISSASGVRPTPLLSEYSASKAYVDFLSRALQAEYRSKGIIIQSVMPYFVATKLSKIRKTSLTVPGPNTYARAALGTVGVQDTTFGCVSHEIQGFVYEQFPEAIYHKVAMALFMPRRNAGLKKLAERQKRK